MLSLMFPVLDVDMRKPYYKPPDTKETHPVSAPEGPSKHRERLARAEMEHPRKLEDLAKAYKGMVSSTWTLDGYFHEFIQEDSLNSRNGDQVVSRYIAHHIEEEEEEAKRQATTVKEASDTSLKVDLDSPKTPHVQFQEASGEETTPSQLESQHDQVKSKVCRLTGLKRIWSVPPHDSTPGEQKEKDGETSDSESVRGKDESLDHVEDGHGAHGKGIPQQIITVPQLWLLQVDNIVLTSFPERWDNNILPDIILERLIELRRRKDESGPDKAMTTDDITSEIVEACLDYEPSLTTYSGARSYLDAFGIEIAHLSNKTTECYEKFKESLGEAITVFPEAIKGETDHLVKIDDVLSEIGMLRRVHEDQIYICMLIERSRNSDKSPKKMSFGLHEDGGEFGYYETRRRRTQLTAKINRLEADATKVRQSIRTLLDLRQRQATTEDAIESSKHSAILFAQSKVLFIFTLATVIFGPLQWVTGLMGMNIENFSRETWSRGDVAEASVAGVFVTIIVSVVGVIVYDLIEEKKLRKFWKTSVMGWWLKQAETWKIKRVKQ
ncbi:hypothetical protein P152DRAFT_32624 [Eremomyces bilateralis CBS 781.70]|uniref:Ankyrin repeat protein n=1 Tax=Eremomyces bilateralis CBS 781.70 TaxID=1392243 RepID=A0A6G1G2Q1_9PEZI|nr:uncharacterized protein P152DRAFT_32624 [Eremomyces bilateralis CBS 781.70]KAF1812323.1 hypothetical protein P152DRAFT_32624 [Eremomyces bilateralis CBS 781.70]